MLLTMPMSTATARTGMLRIKRMPSAACAKTDSDFGFFFSTGTPARTPALKRTTRANVAALNTMESVAPSAATSTPPMAEPDRRQTCREMEKSEFAESRSRDSTSWGIRARKAIAKRKPERDCTMVSA